MTEQDDELRLGYLIHDVSRLRRTLFDKWLAPLGITRSQWWVLAFLSRNDGMPQTELAEELDVGKVALGALILRLEEAGFVKRKSDPEDRRVKRVLLTKQSLELLETLKERNHQFNERVLAGISRRDITATTEALRAMKHNLIEGMKELAGDGEEAAAKPGRGRPAGGRQGPARSGRRTTPALSD